MPRGQFTDPELKRKVTQWMDEQVRKGVSKSEAVRLAEEQFSSERSGLPGAQAMYNWISVKPTRGRKAGAKTRAKASAAGRPAAAAGGLKMSDVRAQMEDLRKSALSTLQDRVKELRALQRQLDREVTDYARTFDYKEEEVRTRLGV